MFAGMLTADQVAEVTLPAVPGVTVLASVRSVRPDGCTKTPDFFTFQ